MLTMHNVRKSYGSTVAIAQLDLAVGEGEIYALLGPNGAGKTTTINLFLGFVQADAGSVAVGGIDPARDPSAARAILAYIPEQVNLYPTLSGLENLRYFARLGGRILTQSEAGDLLAAAGLSPGSHARPLGGYSKGMRQKVGVAIALAKQARAMLLDEPTSGLDPASSHEFSELLRGLAARGIAILMATHDLFRAREVATTIGIMNNGMLLKEMPAPDLSAAELEAAYMSTMTAAL